MNCRLSNVLIFLALATACLAAPDPRRAFLDAFAATKPGQELASIDLPSGWSGKACIQPVGIQTGKWDVWMEHGASVFRIYPFFDEKEGSQAGGYHCLVLKVIPEGLSVKELIAAFTGKLGRKTVRVVEYALYEPPAKLLQRTPAKKKEANQTPEPTAAAGRGSS
jgi:hypothetical protein